jgi:hypothetical protein
VDEAGCATPTLELMVRPVDVGDAQHLFLQLQHELHISSNEATALSS